MKSFLKYVLATVVGIIVSAFILVIFLTFIIVSAVKQSSPSAEKEIKANSVLHISLDHQITEKNENNPFNNLDIPGYRGVKSIGLDLILERINLAKEDDNIKGIYLTPSIVSTGFASLQAIREALKDFKTSGKFVYAYSDMYSQKAYYLASVADSVFVNPQGILDFRGLASSTVFMKEAFDKLGVEMQVVKVGTFKSAVEPFIRNDMSEPNKEQVNSFLNSIYDTFLLDISSSRDLEVDSLKAIADRFAIRNAENAYAHNFVDGAIYKDEVLSVLKEKLDIEQEKKIPSVSLLSYNKKGKYSKTKEQIAVLYAYGAIEDGEGMESTIGGDRISRELRALREDDDVKAVVLRVNSPGGSALASEVIWREVELTKKEKPIIVSMGDYAASGGYYISAAADSIFAEKTTLTGSIGVFGIIPNFKKLMNEKLGIYFDNVKTGKFAAMGADPTQPLTEEEKAIVQINVNQIYDTFLQRVADGRGISPAEVDSLGQGRVWTGEQAAELGLVDDIGDLERAVSAAAGKADLEEYKIQKYPKETDPWSSIFKNGTDKLQDVYMRNKMGEWGKHLETLKNATEQTGVLAKMPYEVEIF